MSWRAGSWVLLVFCLTLLIQLPASWVAHGLGWAATGISGTVWRGQARHIGSIGPIEWDWRPWRLQAQTRVGVQGQAWALDVRGWPWAWHARITPWQAPDGAPAEHRLVGQWQGVIQLAGQGRRCSAAQGRIAVVDLALAAPWSLTLGQGVIEMDCRQGWRLLGRLDLAGQHQASVDADLLARQARLRVSVEESAAITPLLRSAQWLAPGGRELQRGVEW
ncbi:general secretion pathway protein GspN [Pseudomonas capeferrum]|uniref:general secretion pathway protein GspN n=1 Tax=Pseudomonas capeferrum TaxID=1495066 RepID=UPI0015E2A9AD|nr:general secretion pathway protein GspN [Pseudomonas capeferrum]MBA1203698.1 general secretion pathway protein GspN [Pseudomonas capeferrum]